MKKFKDISRKTKIIIVGTVVILGVMVSVIGGIKLTEHKSVESIQKPTFAEVSVHDPSVIKVEDTYYVFGSHLQAAKTNDLMAWTQISTGPQQGNSLIPNPKEEMNEALTWAQTDTFWAGDVIQLEDGKFYMYYCTCKGDSPRSTLGVAVSDNIEGPYTDLGIILKSGMWNQKGEDGKIYDATVHPNTVDPDVFFDKDGKLWMVYGSYSGGIYIMELDPKTGFPYEGQGYGKKVLGGNHSRIEAPYILYNKETDYYYMFLSFGGLDSNGGYNIRVCRSKNPDGPYLDAEGKDMIDCKGASGTLFDDKSIEPYGVKLIGNYQFVRGEGEPMGIYTAYKSPGHNSAYYDEEENKYYIIFHTRFEGQGEVHEVRTHQMFFNDKGWPVIAPYRYAGETIGKYTNEEVEGTYKVINHGRDISEQVKRSVEVKLNKDGTVSGEMLGTWKKTKGNILEIKIEDVIYSGYFISQWDTNSERETMSFTAVSETGEALWGSQIIEENIEE
nr:glycoside hydrolase family 43 protein [uncultured Niameybacter sp.]